MSARRLAIVFAAAFALFAVLAFPLRAAAPALAAAANLDYGRASGTLWRGTLAGAAIGGAALGDVALALNPLYLPIGRLRLAFAFRGRSGEGKGVFESGPGSYFALKRARGALALPGMAGSLPLSGNLSFDIAELAFDSGGCRNAEGTLATDALVQSLARLDWDGPALSGAFRCRAGTLLLPLAGARGPEAVRISSALFPDLRFQTRIEVETETPALMQLLPLAGFDAEGNRLVLLQSGRLSPEWPG